MLDGYFQGLEWVKIFKGDFDPWYLKALRLLQDQIWFQIQIWFYTSGIEIFKDNFGSLVFKFVDPHPAFFEDKLT